MLCNGTLIHKAMFRFPWNAEQLLIGMRDWFFFFPYEEKKISKGERSEIAKGQILLLSVVHLSRSMFVDHYQTIVLNTQREAAEPIYLLPVGNHASLPCIHTLLTNVVHVSFSFHTCISTTIF